MIWKVYIFANVKEGNCFEANHCIASLNILYAPENILETKHVT